MMMIKLFVLLAALLPATIVAESTKTTYFKLTSAPKCTNSVSLSNVAASCDGSNCMLGEELTATGTLSLSAALPDQVCMTTVACFLGINMGSLCRTFSDENINICDVMNADSGTNGSTCPAADTYSFDTSFEIPGEDSSIGSGWWVTATTTLDDCNGSTLTTCTTKIKAVGNRTMSYTGYTAAMAASVLCMGAIVLFVRRRRVGTIDLAYEESQTDVTGGTSSTGNFEMMTDKSVSV